MFKNTKAAGKHKKYKRPGIKHLSSLGCINPAIEKTPIKINKSKPLGLNINVDKTLAIDPIRTPVIAKLYKLLKMAAILI